MAESPRSPQHLAARAAAREGYHVFPCLAGDKKPAVEHWPSVATTDLGTIDAWWSVNPNYNVGCALWKSGHWALDVDPKDGGYESLNELELEHGTLPATKCHKTPSGGRHYIFNGEGDIILNSVRKLGPGLDTRGQHGYIVWCDSILPSGKYRNLSDNAPAIAPEWITAKIKGEKRHEQAQTDRLDTTQSIKAATRELERRASIGDVAIEGSGGNDRTYRLATEMRDYGLSARVAYKLIAEHWNPYCQPPWEAQDLAQIIQHAYEYSQNEAGSKAPRDPNEIFGRIRTSPSTLQSEPSPVEPRFKFLAEDEQEALTPPAWIVEGWFPEHGIAMLYGPWGSYKSFIATELALSRAAGFPFFNIGASPEQTVVYAAGEGAINLAKKRRPAWKFVRKVTDQLPFYVSPRVPEASPEDTQRFVDDLQAQGIKPNVIILDTAARMMFGLDENATQDAGKLVQACETLARVFEPCLVLAIHHSGKDASKGARGSSRFSADFDVVLHVAANRETKCVALICDKQKDAEEPEPIHLIGRQVENSLVFEPITAGEAYDLNHAEEKLTREEFVGALKALEAHGPENAVSNKVLATEIIHAKALENMSVASEKRLVAVFEKLLKKGAALKFEAYVSRESEHLMWCLPASD